MPQTKKAPLSRSEKVSISLICSLGVASIVFSLLSFLDFSKSSPQAGLSSWMRNCGDNVDIASLSIPGSHDSGATHSLADVSGKCQDLSIKDQLEAGARFLDVRLKNYRGTLTVYHGAINQNLSYSSLLNTVCRFLDDHSSETILLSIKEEQAPEGNNESFDALLQKEKKKNEKYWKNDSSLGQLGDHRGGIILLSRYSGSSFGIPMFEGWANSMEGASSNTFDLGPCRVQDFYKVGKIEDKKAEIEASFAYSSSAHTSLPLNFLSGYLTFSFPPSYSVSVASSIIPWAKEKFASYSSLGVVITDFFSSDLGEKIVARNSL